MDQIAHTLCVKFVGDSGVGKTSIVHAFKQGVQYKGSATIGVEYTYKVIKLQNSTIKLNLFDTAGEERYRTLTSSYYRRSHGICFVFSVTDRKSLQNIDIWLQEASQYLNQEEYQKAIIANKIDLVDEREITKEEGQLFAKKHGMLYFETSAKTIHGVNQLFQELSERILENKVILNSLNAEKNLKGYCCK